MHRPLGNCWFISSTHRNLCLRFVKEKVEEGEIWDARSQLGVYLLSYSFPDILLVLETQIWANKQFSFSCCWWSLVLCVCWN